MDFHTYTTMRDSNRRRRLRELPRDNLDQFYQVALREAIAKGSPQFYGQVVNERDWERNRKPYYNVYPSIVPMLTRLNLDLDSSLIHLPFPALCVRLPKDQDKNPLKFDWQERKLTFRCMLIGKIDDGSGISLLIDVGEVMTDIKLPIYTYRNFRRKEGLTVENALRELSQDRSADIGIQIPAPLIDDCVRLCCSLCLLENDPTVISPDVLADDRTKYEDSGDPKYVEKAHRRGKVGWNVGQHIDVMPHYRRPHMMLAWTGAGHSVPKIVPRKGSIIHREVVERLPSGFGEGS